MQNIYIILALVSVRHNSPKCGLKFYNDKKNIFFEFLSCF